MVGLDPHQYFSRAASYNDHTSGYGRMLMANGADQNNDDDAGNRPSQATPNRPYVFCYWLSNWTDNDIRLAEINCMINGVHVGIGWAPAAVGQSIFVFHRWNSGSNTQATIQLIDHSDRAEVSNDFAIDDIDMFDIGNNCLLVAYSTPGGSITTPGEGVFHLPPGPAGGAGRQVQERLRVFCRLGDKFSDRADPV